VVFVNNELDVRILTEHRRKDAHLRRDVLQALMLDARIPSTVDAEVADGQVTLTGAVTWQYQRDEAEFLAGNVRGVSAVRNEVSVASPIPGPRDVKDAITTALQRAARLEAADIGVDTMNGTVRLTGTVGSWWEHDAVLAAAWAAPGVTDVHDHISVRY
jgi:osmotically-inducible protein OsmY